MASENFLRVIPSVSDPWVAVVNGKKYVYPAGTEQYVPAEVAVLIDAQERHEQPKYPPAQGGGGCMVVHITAVAAMDVEAGPQYVADKTHEEIMAAVNSGCNVIAIWPYMEGGLYYGDYVLHLSWLSAEFVGFNAFMLDPYGNFGRVSIYADGHVEVMMPA